MLLCAVCDVSATERANVGSSSRFHSSLDLGRSGASEQPASVEICACRPFRRNACPDPRRYPPRRHGLRGGPSRGGAGAQARRALRLNPARGRGDGDRSRFDRVDYGIRR